MGTIELVARMDGRFSRLLARKRLHPHLRADASFRTMFLDEARIAGLVRHPNVVSVVDVGEDREGPFLLMEYVEGLALSDLIRSKAGGRDLPVEVALEIAAQAAEGLHAAHELLADDGAPLRLVHRDVSPQNVLVGFDGTVRVTDFGVAKALGRGTRTSTGILKGKLGYMSPEQLVFEEPDRRSDIFALGVVLYEMLAGERLYGAGDGLETARRIRDEPPPDIGAVRDDVDDELVQLLFEMLAKDRGSRPADAREVASRLRQMLHALLVDGEGVELRSFLDHAFGELVLARREHVAQALSAARARPRERSLPSRRGAIVGALGLVAAGAAALLIAGGGGGSAAGAPPRPHAPPVAAAPPPPAKVAEAPAAQAAPAPGRVTVRVESSPAGAVVRLDGVTQGRTPATLELDRSSAASSMVLEHDGHRAFETELVPDVDQRLRFSLDRVRRGRSRPAPRARRGAEAPATPTPAPSSQRSFPRFE